MKKLLALVLTLGLAIAVVACGQRPEAPSGETAETATEAAGASTEASDDGQMVMGTLSLLNMTEEERLAWEKGKVQAVEYLVEQGVIQRSDKSERTVETSKVVYYDTLDALVMALEAGDIDSAQVPQCTADYLCAHNDKLRRRSTFNLDGADEFTKRVAYRLGVGYSFLTTEENAALRDELDEAISEMREDGTLDSLTKAYITDAVDSDPDPVELPQADGETLRVAVTGSLPPMDYVAADGTPAGFNTALLAELSRRLGVSFELVQVDSVGRATALSSGQVDLVFWTNGIDGRDPAAGMTDEEFLEFLDEKAATATEEQRALMKAIDGTIDWASRVRRDLPEGTIATQAYYSDLLALAALKN